MPKWYNFLSIYKLGLLAAKLLQQCIDVGEMRGRIKQGKCTLEDCRWKPGCWVDKKYE